MRAAIAGDDVVINCAAWTDVDGAEEHEQEALRINRDGARNLAEAAGRVIYVSTDYVFDGTKREPYLESDPVNPQTAYGRTKLAGERATAEANPRHHIVRTSWLFGPGGPNFVETMLRLARERDEVRVVDDQVGYPTYTGHLAAGAASSSRPARSTASTTSPAPGSAPGSSSPLRSSSAPGSTAASSRARPRSSRVLRRDPPTRCSAASASPAAHLAGGPRRLPGRVRV